ncbi:MAG: hypothetical protein ACOVOE_01455, partial [Caulobacter sp.]
MEEALMIRLAALSLVSTLALASAALADDTPRPIRLN